MSSISSSISSSTPTVIQTPENDIINNISGVASQLASQMNAWAQQAYAKTSAITDQTVNNFLTSASNMADFSNSMQSAFNSNFLPEYNQLTSDANSYASPERMAVDMGMAGATQAQANQAAMDNATRNLQSYGIDPSSGRYAALDKAAAVQGAANIAGAMNQQRQTDIQTGQNLRQQALQIGAQLPAAITNATNAATQANTGATNASLANANTGANLNSIADKYLNTAMQVKMPLMGNQSYSSSQSMSSDPSGGGGSGTGYSGSGEDDATTPSGTSWSGMGSGGGGDPAVGSYDGSNSGGVQGAGGDYSYNGPVPSDMDWSYLDGYGTGTGYVGQSNGDSTDYVGSNPFSDSGFGQTYGGDDSGAAWGFAQGGAVPTSASPTNGRTTDDVPARLNAGEFVVPKDVVAFKGQEFFQKLIAQSRKMRQQAPAHGHRAPAPNQAPTFVSR